MIAAAAALTVTPLAAAGGTAGAWWNQAPTDGLKWLSATEATFLDAFAEALFPVGSLPGPGGGSAGLAYYLDDLFVGLEEVQRNLIRLGMHGLDHLPLVTHGARFQELPRETATALVETWLFGGGLAELRGLASSFYVFLGMGYLSHPEVAPSFTPHFWCGFGR